MAKSISIKYGEIDMAKWRNFAVWRNRFPLNNINACWFLLLVQCAQTVLKNTSICLNVTKAINGYSLWKQWSEMKVCLWCRTEAWTWERQISFINTNKTFTKSFVFILRHFESLLLHCETDEWSNIKGKQAIKNRELCEYLRNAQTAHTRWTTAQRKNSVVTSRMKVLFINACKIEIAW